MDYYFALLDLTDDSDEAACARLREGLVRLNRALDVPSPRAWGIEKEAWDARLGVMAEQALASGSPANNPRVPTREEIVALYREVYAGEAG